MIIKDCIYDFVEVPPLCKPFIDTKEFQRLRHIKQLGFTYLVYPSATHTRFEHCLGVMHLAGAVVDSLRKTSVSGVGVIISEREKFLVQLAGLYHDVGHVASSHLLDYILEERGVGNSHEERSCEILESVNDRVGVLTKEEVEVVKDMICGRIRGRVRGDKDKTFLYEIVSNSTTGIDVDRMDYLQRDAYHTGISQFRPWYLIRSMRVVDGRLVLVEKARTDVEMLYYTRAAMFTLVYRHKTVLEAERVVRDIVGELDIVEKWDESDYLELDDNTLLYHMKRSDKYPLIYNRAWKRDEKGESGVESQFSHCSTISRDEIEREVGKITWI